jgi:hypothetical protein
VESILGAVAVVHVEVEHRHALQAVRLDRVQRGRWPTLLKMQKPIGRCGVA